ncbi:MAG: hypothetical protein D6813_13860 [Calditrichaeota bacterium]|nr:MAG: hypothetical protein D6813_13860 [Calditrichota bacterium]
MKTIHQLFSKFSCLIVILLFIFCSTFAQEFPIPLLRTLSGHRLNVSSLAFNPEGNILASGSWDNTIKLWEVESGKELYTLKGHFSSVYSVTFSPYGRILASGSEDNTIKLWDVVRGQELRTLSGHRNSVYWVAFSPDGKIIASGDFDNIIKMWDVTSGREIHTLRGHRDRVYSVAFSPDGRILASGSDDSTIKLWDVVSGREMRSLSGNRFDISSIAFNPEGNIIGSGGGDGIIMLWNVTNGQVIRTLRVHTNSVNCIAFSPGGTAIASGSNDKTIKICEISSGRELCTITGHTGAIYSIAFSPMENILASGSYDHTIKIWNISALNTELYIIYSSIKSEKEAALQSIANLFSPKDEFETTSEYQARIQKAEAEKKAIEEKYARKFAEMKEAYLREKAEQEQIAAEKHRQQQLAEERTRRLREAEEQQRRQEQRAQSLENVQLAIEKVGTYDADRETLPIVIAGQSYILKIPRSEARSFKQFYARATVRGQKQLKKNLHDWEYFNLMVEHPETGSRYVVGPQHQPFTLSGEVAKVEVPAVTPRGKKLTGKPHLLLTPEFFEPSGNGFLDAEETGKLTIVVNNKGNGTAYGVILDLKPMQAESNIQYTKSRIISELLPGENKEVSFTIEASMEVGSGKHEFMLTGRESNGFAPDPIKISIETAAFRAPQLVVADMGIETASGDNQIEVEEIATLTLRIQNRGQRIAEGVQAFLEPGENVFLTTDSKKFFALGDMSPASYQDVSFRFYTNKLVKKQIPISVKITEKRGKFTHSETLDLAVNRPMKTLAQFQFEGKERPVIIEDVTGLSVDIEKDIPNTAIQNSHAVAVVIGNRDYQKTASVDFAINDAQLMKQYLIKTFGLREGNIIYETNATQATFNSIFGTENEFRGKLYNYVKAGESDVFVYYSGHGVPDPETKKAYFVPVNCDPSFVKLNGYSLDLFYNNLSKLPAKSVTVVINACFSGASERGNLIPNISPALLSVENPVMRIHNSLVMTSAANDQVSSWYPEKKHSLFTYFFLKGLKGEADKNSDSKVTFRELQDYIDENVPYMARRLNNREQTPHFMGNKDFVLIRLK